MQRHRLQEPAHEPPQFMSDTLTISQVARLTGVNAKAIRYYESIGLLPRPARSLNSYRRYTSADVNRLLLLRRIRSLGVPLASAKALLIGATDALCADVQQDLLHLVNARLAALDQEIAALHHLRDELESYQQKLAYCPADSDEAFRTCADMSCFAPFDEITERRAHHGDECTTK